MKYGTTTESRESRRGNLGVTFLGMMGELVMMPMPDLSGIENRLALIERRLDLLETPWWRKVWENVVKHGR